MSDGHDNVVYLGAWRQKMDTLNDSHRASVSTRTNGALFTAILEVLQPYGIDMHHIPHEHFMEMIEASDKLADLLVRVIEFHQKRKRD